MEAIDTRTFSPKELAQVIGVSESSIKRWVDDGLIDVTRTAGGHRRIPLREALRFVRSRHMRVMRPEMLDLPDVSGLPPEAREGELTGDVLFHLLRHGEASKARGVIAHRFVNGTPLSNLFDGPMAEALSRLGELWKHGEEGIYIEHMATTICLEALNQLRGLIPPAGRDAPVALGGALSGDPYILPSLMAATILLDAGYRDINLGADTPHAAFLRAVDEHQPALVWVAATSHLTKDGARQMVDGLLQPLAQRGVTTVVGGRSSELMAGDMPDGVDMMSSMAALAALAAEASRNWTAKGARA